MLHGSSCCRPAFFVHERQGFSYWFVKKDRKTAETCLSWFLPSQRSDRALLRKNTLVWTKAPPETKACSTMEGVWSPSGARTPSPSNFHLQKAHVHLIFIEIPPKALHRSPCPTLAFQTKTKSRPNRTLPSELGRRPPAIRRDDFRTKPGDSACNPLQRRLGRT